jgi:hypothetical protein
MASKILKNSKRNVEMHLLRFVHVATKQCHGEANIPTSFGEIV